MRVKDIQNFDTVAECLMKYINSAKCFDHFGNVKDPRFRLIVLVIHFIFRDVRVRIEIILVLNAFRIVSEYQYLFDEIFIPFSFLLSTEMIICLSKPLKTDCSPNKTTVFSVSVHIPSRYLKYDIRRVKLNTIL